MNKLYKYESDKVYCRGTVHWAIIDFAKAFDAVLCDIILDKLNKILL